MPKQSEITALLFGILVKKSRISGEYSSFSGNPEEIVYEQPKNSPCLFSFQSATFFFIGYLKVIFDRLGTNGLCLFLFPSHCNQDLALRFLRAEVLIRVYYVGKRKIAVNDRL